MSARNHDLLGLKFCYQVAMVLIRYRLMYGQAEVKQVDVYGELGISRQCFQQHMLNIRKVALLEMLGISIRKESYGNVFSIDMKKFGEYTDKMNHNLK